MSQFIQQVMIFNLLFIQGTCIIHPNSQISIQHLKQMQSKFIQDQKTCSCLIPNDNGVLFCIFCVAGIYMGLIYPIVQTFLDLDPRIYPPLSTHVKFKDRNSFIPLQVVLSRNCLCDQSNSFFDARNRKEEVSSFSQFSISLLRGTEEVQIQSATLRDCSLVAGLQPTKGPSYLLVKLSASKREPRITPQALPHFGLYRNCSLGGQGFSSLCVTVVNI